MLAPGHITFITIFGGSFMAAMIMGIMFFANWKRSVEPMQETHLGVAVLANCMTLGTIGALIYNTSYLVVHKSFLGGAVTVTPTANGKIIDSVFPIDQAGLGIVGNEATAFFAFTYAFVMISANIFRNVKQATTAAPPGEKPENKANTEE